MTYPHIDPAWAPAVQAVEWARSRIGCEYVWGAEGPTKFDCSGLVDWSFNQSDGPPLPRTTADGYSALIPHRVSRSQLQLGMVVIPHPGHIQIYSGNGNIIEAPRTGLTVREVPLWGFFRAGYLPGYAYQHGLGNHPKYPGHLLKYGDRGRAVQAVKNRLGGGGEIFGPWCLAHVKAFQRAHHLQVDGVVGPKTWGALF